MPKRKYMKRIRIGESRRNEGYYNWFPKVLPYTRTLLSMLPVTQAGIAVRLLDIVDLGFNWVKTVLKSTAYYHGAYTVFLISPAPLIANSPLLATSGDGTTFSYPGHPVRMNSLDMLITNTSALRECSGQWSAVFIPFLNEKDVGLTTKMSNLTFSEVSSMPRSVTAPASKPLKLAYSFHDRSQYCAQPRKLVDYIGFVVIIWDVRSRADSVVDISGETFNCQVFASGSISPYVIFGPSHRTILTPSDMKLKCLTDGTKVRVYDADTKTTSFEEFTSDDSWCVVDHNDLK